MKLCNYPSPDLTRYYEIEAIELPIVYNKYGDHDPNGLLYVLKKDAARIREGALRNFSLEVPQPYEEVKPLVIRANQGEKNRNFFFPFTEPPAVHPRSGNRI